MPEHKVVWYGMIYQSIISVYQYGMKTYTVHHIPITNLCQSSDMILVMLLQNLGLAARLRLLLA